MNCLDAGSGVIEQLKQNIKYHKWIPIRSPELKFYAEEIVSGQPFSPFTRHYESNNKEL